jgi:hypothetical protein
MDLNSKVLKGVKKRRKEFDKASGMSANHYGEVMLRSRIAVSRWELFFADRDFLICPSRLGPAYARTKVGSKLRCEGTEIPFPQAIPGQILTDGLGFTYPNSIGGYAGFPRIWFGDVSDERWVRICR